MPFHLDTFWSCLVIALAASSLSLTLTQTELFAPWRRFAARIHPQIGHLASCFYCTSHWVVFAGIALYQPAIIHSGYALLDLLTTAFFTLTLATLTSGVMFKVFLMAMATHSTRAAMEQAAQAAKSDTVGG